MPAISPARGEIRCLFGFRQSPTLQEGAQRAELPISPLAGEMSGRTEGG
ncbi:MAG: propionyl-coenzyme A carboxylase alpha polypeptide, partial [Mesorhizobium sp.]